MNNNTRCIKFETILNFYRQASNMACTTCLKDFADSTIYRTNLRLASFIQRVLISFAKRILERLNIRLTYVRDLKDVYYFGSDKIFCLNFLDYCLGMGNRLLLDLSPFIEEDKKEIIKFVRNNIIGALLDKVEKDKVFDSEDIMQAKEYEKYKKKIVKKGDLFLLKYQEKRYFLPVNYFTPVVFHHKYGIPLLPKDARKRIIGKDIIDGGAFVGDSTLILNEFDPREIYAFELLRDHIQLMNRTIKINKLSNVHVVEKALGCYEGISKAHPLYSRSFMSETGSTAVSVTTIDHFVSEHGLEVGLIKMDIEGAEYDALLGAEKTISEQRPVLIISVYHDGRSFFEIPKKS